MSGVTKTKKLFWPTTFLFTATALLLGWFAWYGTDDRTARAVWWGVFAIVYVMFESGLLFFCNVTES